MSANPLDKSGRWPEAGRPERIGVLVAGRRRRMIALAATIALTGAPMAGVASASPAPSHPSVRVAPSPDHLVPRYWTVAPSLLKLRDEVDARWPGRSRAYDGTIGDHRHAHMRSDHNPVGHINGPRYGTKGMVHAIDITARGLDADAVLRATVGDHRVWYVIYAGQIWSRTYGWAPQRYFGNDPHYSHLHISLVSSTQSAARSAEYDRSSWFGSGSGGTGSPSASAASQGSGKYRIGASGGYVRTLQQRLIARGFTIRAGATGYYGTQTRSAVRSFQRAQGWRGGDADGFPGPTTLRLLANGGGASTPKARTVSSGSNGSASGSLAGLPAGWLYKPGIYGSGVKQVQRALIKRGYTISAGATGYLGAQTRAAVRSFQRNQGWTDENHGIPGPKTLRALGLA